MHSAEEINFGVEIEGFLLDSEEKIRSMSRRSINALPPETQCLFEQNAVEIEAKNNYPGADLTGQREDITKQVKRLKAIAALGQRRLSFDSRLNQDTALETIGTHVHLDLSLFPALMQKDPDALSLVVAEFMRSWFKLIIDQYCYSRRIKSRIAYVLEKTDFSYQSWDDHILKSDFIPFNPKRDHVKLIKHRPDKGSLEICLPDSFDVTQEPDTFERLVTDCRRALFACINRYEQNETRPMNDQELFEILSRVL